MATPKKGTVKFNMTGLNVIQTSLKKMADSKYRIQVGIFGNKDLRKNSAGPTNAEIGLIHEMGSHSRGIPQRSFLWDTFALHGEELNRQAAPFVLTLFKTGKVDEYLQKVGHLCTDLVDMAFETGGFGNWAPDKPETIFRKLHSAVRNVTRRHIEALKASYGGHEGIDWTLVDTGQLRGAVDYRVVKS